MITITETTTPTTECQRKLLGDIANDSSAESYVESRRLGMANRLCSMGYLNKSARRTDKGGMFRQAWTQEVVSENAFSTMVRLSPLKPVLTFK